MRTYVRAFFVAVAVFAGFGLVITLLLAFGPAPYSDPSWGCRQLATPGSVAECPQPSARP